MSGKELAETQQITEIWHTYLTTGDLADTVGAPWYASKQLRRFYLHLPAEPRCRLCYYPFHGIGGRIMRRFFGVVPSKFNPNLCNQCDQFLMRYPGGAETDLTILFADVRGSTHLAETMNPTEFSQLINRFYNATTRVLFERGALVEKLSGDAVTAFFTPGFSGADHARVAVEAGREILQATGHSAHGQPWVPVGVGIHTGKAFVGTVTADSGVNDIAVLGDTANIGARLSSLAGVGELLVSRDTALQAGMTAEGVSVRNLDLKGRSEPVEAWVL